MQVVLTETIPKLGYAYDIVNVKRGFAANYLLPQKKAVLATPAAIARAEKVQAERLKKMEEMLANAKETAKKLEGIALTFKKKVKGDKLYGSIAQKDIVEALASDHKMEFDKSMVKIEKPIKTLGEHEVSLHLAEGIDVALKVTVEAEG